MVKDGRKHIDSLRDGRRIFIDRECVDDPIDHPAFRNAIMYPKFVNTLRELSGGGMIMLPSSVVDFDNPGIADWIGKTQRSPATDSVGRVKLFKLAWDAVGSEFGSRHLQYEVFYAGANMVTCGHAFRTYDWDKAVALVDGFMAAYDRPQPHAQKEA